MKKILIPLGIFTGILLILLVAGRVTGALGWYKNTTPANEPTLKTGETFLTSNLKTPVRGNFIIYRNRYSDSNTQLVTGRPIISYNYVKRLCGMPGDILEMRNGVLFVNSRNYDENLVLKSFYKTTITDLNKSSFNLDSLRALDMQEFMQMDQDTVVINLDDRQVALLKKQVVLKRFIRTENTDVFGWLDNRSSFNADNWGPLTVPPDCYFVLGDNRHNSLDSRYFGFVEKKNCRGVVLWK